MSSLVILLAIVAAGIMGYLLGKRDGSPTYNLDAPPEEPKTDARLKEMTPAPEQTDSPTTQASNPAAAQPTVPAKQIEAEPGDAQQRKEVSAASAEQTRPVSSARTTSTQQQDTEPSWKEMQSPITVKRAAVFHRQNGNEVNCSYSYLATNTERFLKLLQNQGFALDRFEATELHDRYEDFDSYWYHTFDEALLEQRWKEVHGAWKISGSYHGASVLVDECHPGLTEGILVKYAEADAKAIEPLLAAIERAFAPDLFIMDGSTVVSYRGKRKHILLPSTTPYTCEAIGKSAFEGNDGLVSVVIPPSVTSIGQGAFKDCKNLESVVLVQQEKQTFNRATKKLVSSFENNPVDIGSSAFEGCKSLKRIKLHPGVKSLGSRAFFGCSSLEQVNLYDSLTSIGNQTFMDCNLLSTAGPQDSSEPYSIELGYRTQIPKKLFAYHNKLKRVVVPDGVKRLGADAFFYCDNLEEIVLPDSLEVIESNAIGFCPKLRKLNIPTGAQIEGSLLRGCGALADEDGFVIHNNVLYEYAGHRVHVKIPDGVTRIADRAFAYYPTPGVNHGDIVSVTIPSSVESIGAAAFYDCGKLTDVDMPDSVSVADNAFANCRSLRKKDAEPAPKRSENVEWSWEMEPLKLAIDNSDPSSKNAKKVRSYQATFLGGPSGSLPGKLVIAPASFSFTATTDKQGWPSVKGTYGSQTNPFSRDGQKLIIRATDGEYRFELKPSDLDAIEYLGLEHEDSAKHIGAFSGSIADGCVRDSWPGVAHPFFDRHAGPQTDKAAVFKFIGWSFVTTPLDWKHRGVSIEHSRHKLRVTSEQGAEEYRYYETPDTIEVSYDTESFGFFDDSGYSESARFSLRFMANPTDEEVGQARDVREVRGNESSCYLRDPFGMTGVFKVTRSKSRG